MDRIKKLLDSIEEEDENVQHDTSGETSPSSIETTPPRTTLEERESDTDENDENSGTDEMSVHSTNRSESTDGYSGDVSDSFDTDQELCNDSECSYNETCTDNDTGN